MLLLSIKKKLQSYNAQSSKQREIFSFKEIAFERLQETAGRDFTSFFPRDSDIYMNPCPGTQFIDYQDRIC